MEATKEMVLLFLHAVQRMSQEVAKEIGRGIKTDFTVVSRKSHATHMATLVLERVIIRGLPVELYPLTDEEKRLAPLSHTGETDAMLSMNNRLSMEKSIGDIVFSIQAYQILGDKDFNKLFVMMDEERKTKEEAREKAIVRAIMAPAAHL